MERIFADGDFEAKRSADGALKQLRLSLQLLASTAQEQMSHFPPRSVVVADEFALDFENWASYVCAYWKLSQEQTNSLEEIDNFFEEMSHLPNNTFWKDEAIHTDPRWSRVRNLAKAALVSFGWPLVVPPPARYCNGMLIDGI